MLALSTMMPSNARGLWLSVTLPGTAPQDKTRQDKTHRPDRPDRQDRQDKPDTSTNQLHARVVNDDALERQGAVALRHLAAALQEQPITTLPARRAIREVSGVSVGTVDRETGRPDQTRPDQTDTQAHMMLALWLAEIFFRRFWIDRQIDR
jgi:hypothetical protein